MDQMTTYLKMLPSLEPFVRVVLLWIPHYKWFENVYQTKYFLRFKATYKTSIEHCFETI